MLTELRQDLAYALRLFKRSPGFASVAVVTLALGLGATTTIFTLAELGGPSRRKWDSLARLLGHSRAPLVVLA